MLPFYRFLSVLALLVISILNIQAQTCQPAPLGGENCADAPLMSCNLDGYMGTTAGYLPGPPPNDFCGLVENDQYFRFIVDEIPVAISIIPSDCTTGKGLQAALYLTSDCVNFELESLCASFGAVAPLNVISENVVVGQELYLMIDGFEGDICDFTVQVSQGILPDVEAEADNAELCIGNQINLDGLASTQRVNVEYLWNTTTGNIVSGANTLTPTVDAIGDYTLSVVDVVSCCIDEVTISVSENTSAPTYNFDAAYEINCADLTATLDPNLANPTGFTYTWTTIDGTISPTSNPNTSSIEVSAAGTYTLEIEDTASGCIHTQDVVVTEDVTPPNIVALSTNNLDCFNPSTSISGNSTFMGLSYSWTGPNMFVSNDQSFTANEAGTYFVTVTAPNGCTAMTDVTVTSSGNPDGTISKENDLDCTDADTGLTASSATPGVTFDWTGPSGPIGSMAQITATEGGVYTLIVTSPTGCTTTVTETVVEDMMTPNISAVSTNDIDCTNINATLQGASTTPGVSFLWTGPNMFTSTSPDPVITMGGAYTLEVTGLNGCAATMPITVIENATPPIAEAGTAMLLNCNTPTTTIGDATTSMGPEFTYEWTSTTSPGVLGTNATLPVSGMGMYTLVVTNINSDCSTTSSVLITEDFDKPTVDVGPTLMLTCSTREATLGGGTSSTGPEFVYTWTNGAGDMLSNDPTFTTSVQGDYTLSIENTINGCTEAATVTVNDDPTLPVAAVPVPDTLTCNETTVTLSSSGSSSGVGVTYAWTDNNNTFISSDPNVDISISGTYQLVVTDNNLMCADSILVRVEENVMAPLGNAGVDKDLDCVNTDATLEASVAGNMNDFSFEWFNSAGNSVSQDSDFTTSDVGQYDLVITDNFTGCTVESFATIIDNSVFPDADSGLPVTITCAETLVEIGGTNSSMGSNIIHSWFDPTGNPVGNTPTIDAATQGDYRLVVTDVANSCTTEAFVTVSIDQNEPTPNVGNAATITCNDPVIILNGNQSSTFNNGAIAYEWLDPNGQSISSIEDASASISGGYELIITDTQNGCTNSASIFVPIDTIKPIVEVTNPEIINCYNNFVEVNYTSTNGPITPIWRDDMGNIISNEESYLATEVGMVVLEATSQANGCVSTASIDIVEDLEAPTADFLTPDVLTCVTTESTLTPNITNFTSDANFEWTDNTGQVVGSGADLVVSDDGIYTVEIQKVENGCTAEFFVTVLEDVEVPEATITNSANRLDCFDPSIDFSASLSTGNAPLEYTWTNASQDTLSMDESFMLTEGGNVTLLVTNTVNGCTDEASVPVVQDQEAPAITFTPTDILTCVDNVVNVESVLNATHNSFSYTWTGPSTSSIVAGGNTSTISVDTIGAYTLVVQNLLNGCESTEIIQVEEDRVLPDLEVAPIAELNCVTDMVTIDASNSSGGTQFEYAWTGASINTGQGTPAIEVNSAGEYSLTILNTETGCENTMLVEVDENLERPVGASLFMADPSCFGERDGILDVENVIGGAAPYLYAINSETNFTDINTYANLPSGEYTLVVQDNIGCEWDTLFQITDPEQVSADLGEDQIIRLGEESELFVQTTGNVVSFAWTDNGEAGPIDVDFREIAPLTTTTYIVVVTNSEGCSGTDNIVVEVEDDRRVYIPTAFSPNGDGVNDFFTVFTDIAATEVTSLAVFDRWGNQVFEKNNFLPNIPENGWDGIWRGQNMQPGTYVYSAFIEFIDGTKINFKGEINIVY